MRRLRAALEAERPVRGVELSEEERRRLRGFSLLSLKPLLLVLNLGEDRIRQAESLIAHRDWGDIANGPGVELCAVSAPIETEIAELSREDAAAFLEDLGFREPGLHRVIRTSYALLGLISFLTSGQDECRAWTIHEGMNAHEAAGAIHTDISRGFIRAEVVPSSGLYRPARSPPRASADGSDWKARNTSFRTAMSFTSVLISEIPPMDAPDLCPRCHRAAAARRDTCLYCGARLPQNVDRGSPRRVDRSAPLVFSSQH